MSFHLKEKFKSADFHNGANWVMTKSVWWKRMIEKQLGNTYPQNSAALECFELVIESKISGANHPITWYPISFLMMKNDRSYSIIFVNWPRLFPAIFEPLNSMASDFCMTNIMAKFFPWSRTIRFNATDFWTQNLLLVSRDILVAKRSYKIFV